MRGAYQPSSCASSREREGMGRVGGGVTAPAPTHSQRLVSLQKPEEPVKQEWGREHKPIYDDYYDHDVSGLLEDY